MELQTLCTAAVRRIDEALRPLGIFLGAQNAGQGHTTLSTSLTFNHLTEEAVCQSKQQTLTRRPPNITKRRPSTTKKRQSIMKKVSMKRRRIMLILRTGTANRPHNMEPMPQNLISNNMGIKNRSIFNRSAISGWVEVEHSIHPSCINLGSLNRACPKRLAPLTNLTSASSPVSAASSNCENSMGIMKTRRVGRHPGLCRPMASQTGWPSTSLGSRHPTERGARHTYWRVF